MEYSSTKSCAKLFRISLKKELFGVVWAERQKNLDGFDISKNSS